VNHSLRLKLATATFSMAAALASPTFGINLTFDTTRSSVVYFHDAESLDATNTENVHVRNKTITGAQIGSGSAPGYQLGSANVNQNGGAGTGSSTGRIGIGHIEDSRTASMTLQSLSFVNQNEVNTTNASLKMDGNSIITADFSLSWIATGNFGPPLIGKISIPLSGFVTGTGSASVTLENVRWIVDQVSDGLDNGTAFDARTAFTGAVNFVAGGPTSATLTSTSATLTKSGSVLGMKAGDVFTLKGKLIFAADGNSPASINFGQIGEDYGPIVLNDSPTRFYRLNEDGFYTPPFEEEEGGEEIVTFDVTRSAFDSSGNGQHGEYVGGVSPEARTAQASMGTGAQFPQSSISTDSTFGPSITSAGIFDVILVPNAPDVQFGTPAGGRSFTLEAWVAREDDFGADNSYFASIIDMQDGSGDGLRFGINNNTIFLTGGNGVVPGTNAILNLGPGEFFQLDTFYHLVAVFDDFDGMVEFFVNGASVGELSYALLTNSGDANIRIGNGFNGFNPFIGLIDEVAIYDYTLDSESIDAHYRGGLDDPRLVPLMGFVEIPEPASAALALLAMGSLVMPRRQRGR